MTAPNPNGLSDEEIAARPEPFVGMAVFNHAVGSWQAMLDKGYLNWICLHGHRHILLPGERGCPWPPPPEFHKTDWKEGDRAWALVDLRDDGGQWCKLIVLPGAITGKPTFYIGPLPIRIDIPAIYIPEEDTVSYEEYVAQKMAGELE